MLDVDGAFRVVIENEDLALPPGFAREEFPDRKLLWSITQTSGAGAPSRAVPTPAARQDGAPATRMDGEKRWPGLMQAAQAGDRLAYAKLLRELRPVLQALVRRRGIGPAHVEDVVQDALMTLHRIRHAYDPRLPFMPWIAAIATRRSIDALRRDGRRGRWETSSPGAIEAVAAPVAACALEARETRELLSRAIDRLPPAERRAVRLVKLEDMSLADAAAAGGQSKGALKVNVHRGIRRLRGLVDRSAA